MGRPATVTASDVLRALQQGELSPSALTQALKASRSTVHRLLGALDDKGLVVRVRKGPRASWRLATPQDGLQRAEEQRRKETVAMTLTWSAAASFRSMLELYVRLCLGQWEEVVDLARWGSLRRTDGRALDFDELENLSAELARVKQDALGFSSSASWGIYAPVLKDGARVSWQVYKAVRHRMAWDWRPQGGVGVDFDEPLESELADGLLVYSREDEGGKYLHVEMAAAHVELLARALRVARRVMAADLAVLLELQESGEAPAKEPRGPEQTQRARQRLQTLKLGSRDDVPAVHGEALAKLFEPCLQGENKPTVAEYLEDGKVHVLRLEPCAQRRVEPTLKDLPASMLIGYDRGKYRIVGPGQDGHTLVILGESHSLQTAILMARNAAARVPARNPGP